MPADISSFSKIKDQTPTAHVIIVGHTAIPIIDLIIDEGGKYFKAQVFFITQGRYIKNDLAVNLVSITSGQQHLPGFDFRGSGNELLQRL